MSSLIWAQDGSMSDEGNAEGTSASLASVSVHATRPGPATSKSVQHSSPRPLGKLHPLPKGGKKESKNAMLSRPEDEGKRRQSVFIFKCEGLPSGIKEEIELRVEDLGDSNLELSGKF